MRIKARGKSWWRAAAVATLACAAVAAATVTTAAAAARGAAGAGAGGTNGVPAGFRPQSVSFVSAGDGWVLGRAACSGRPCTAILRTTSGGRIWQRIHAPAYPLAPSGSGTGLYRLRFANRSDGFAFGTQLWATRDGGSSWRHVPLPGAVADLEAAAGRVYAAVSTSPGKITIYRSPAGRDSWHPVSGLPAVSSYAGLGTITMHGTAAWIILGSRLYVTRTGATWSESSLRCPKNYGLVSVGAYSARRVTALCSGQPALGSTQKALFASRNGGTSFARAGTPPPGGDGGYLAQPGADHVFIATSSGATWLYESTDGGGRWHDDLTLSDGGLGWGDFGFVSASHGAAVEGNPRLGSHLYLTGNAGRTWHRVSF